MPTVSLRLDLCACIAARLATLEVPHVFRRSPPWSPGAVGPWVAWRGPEERMELHHVCVVDEEPRNGARRAAASGAERIAAPGRCGSP